VQRRLHILDGLLIVFLNIDEVIAIIRQQDEPKPALMTRFALSDTQTDAILDLRLRRLGRLQEIEIRNEQQALASEAAQLEKLLASPRRLQTLLKKEIMRDAERFGNARCSPLVTRQAAQALNEMSLVTNEPVTVVVSEKGWVRAAKGHDIDPTSLSYKAGDCFSAAARGKSTQLATFLDSTGRSYALASHTLPSARSQGEPLSGRLSPPDGASFVGLMVGEPDDLYVLASDAGYGFVVALGDLQTRQRAGKVVLTAPPGSHILAPAPIQHDGDISDMVAVVSNTGRLLIFPLTQLLRLSKAKGHKLMGLASNGKGQPQETVIALACFPQDQPLTLYCGQRHLTLKASDAVPYMGNRGRRGAKLPRGFQRVDRLCTTFKHAATEA
jgi:topoisomerase-4 subunit A